MKRFDYYRPQSLIEVWRQKEKVPDSLFIAGGTDLLVQIKNGEASPSVLISLRSIPELSGIQVEKITRIGAMTTITDLIQHPVLHKYYPALIEGAKRLGSNQIRNVATIGGNLCNASPCADMAIPLLVLEAKVRLQSNLSSRIIPLNEFFKGPGETCLKSGEILAEIQLGLPLKSSKSAFLKKGRTKMDLAIVSVAALLEMKGERCTKARLAAGSVAPVPLRLSKVEALLESASLSRKLIVEAQHLAISSIAPISDIRASKEYRQEIFGICIKHALEKVMGRSYS